MALWTGCYKKEFRLNLLQIEQVFYFWKEGLAVQEMPVLAGSTDHIENGLRNFFQIPPVP